VGQSGEMSVATAFSVTSRLWQQRASTGNSNMVAQTGNIYISVTMTDNIEIPTAIFNAHSKIGRYRKWRQNQLV